MKADENVAQAVKMLIEYFLHINTDKRKIGQNGRWIGRNKFSISFSLSWTRESSRGLKFKSSSVRDRDRERERLK